MLPPLFEKLRERLLRAGVSPRHVQRYLRELREHHDDALQAELAKGASPAAASAAAWARLGSEESLAQSVLERPELRSTAARFPALVFGVGPALTWLGAPLAIATVLSLLPEASRHVEPTAGFIDLFYGLCFLHTRLLPVLIGAVALEAAARRRSSKGWPLVGTAAVDVLAGTLTVYALPGQLGVTSSLLPWLLPFSTVFGPASLQALGEGLLRATAMLALSLVLQRVLQHVLRRLAVAEAKEPAQR